MKYSILMMIIIVSLIMMNNSVKASEWEFSAHVGQSWAPDLNGFNNGDTITIDDGINYGLGIAWFDSPTGMGQVLFNHVKHDFTSEYDQSQQSLDILYGHFNGIALFRQENYTTTVSLGLGGAAFETEQNNELYPSATLALGTRYEFSDNLSFFTELRGYASLVDEDDNVFCQAESCHAQFEDNLWFEANVTIGIAFRF
ncbi:hypothetical protein Q4489_05110 [Thalassotalea sp. 1_MG-2023]|uniref:hypothetical protein n=1 Tax=Thalassotalea sp. 1_MG-2023 TaxID=3062680 RepID=UPI0026E33F2F|nr:hypothetical protein [Thalassotalea sp. 1_MG-2023]MDO6426380.1 hypothetical protein [Thalassotalea sp. 1_MG-2023]